MLPNTHTNNKYYYTPLPGPILNKLEPWLAENNIDYSVMQPDEVPDTVPQCYTFNGHTSYHLVVYVYSELTPDVLIAKAEELFRDQNN